ncbi:hypothetical protein [Bacillus tuaregi]|uniref:hypothetical protein n=1 Tax=Bacillus tuaregi TaxID=1816695 RepID=UPI0008F889BA|nr:hypothetical protein [Bacillus tuaregi]
MEKYAVLTNKDTFQTVLENDALELVETYQFYFFDSLKATYTIAKIVDDHAKITLYEKYDGKDYINKIHVKFFETFPTIEEAREELNEIVKASGNSEDSQHSKLVKIENANV